MGWYGDFGRHRLLWARRDRDLRLGKWQLAHQEALDYDGVNF